MSGCSLTLFEPKKSWGYREVQYDSNIDHGCVFYKLFTRAFPNHFKPDSVYAHFPMTIPSENHTILKDLGTAQHYSFDRPQFIPPRVNIVTYNGAKSVLERQDIFKVTWGGTLKELMGEGGAHFML